MLAFNDMGVALQRRTGWDTTPAVAILWWHGPRLQWLGWKS